jgi:ribosome-associated protein
VKKAPAAKKAAGAKAAAREEVRSQAQAGLPTDKAADLILKALDDDKAEDIVSIDIKGKSSVADMLIVASGRSQRHVAALADHLLQKLKEAGATYLKVEGLPHADWVLVDAGDVIVHLFRPDVRTFYNIERIWSPVAAAHAAAG